MSYTLDAAIARALETHLPRLVAAYERYVASCEVSAAAHAREAEQAAANAAAAAAAARSQEHLAQAADRSNAVQLARLHGGAPQ